MIKLKSMLRPVLGSLVSGSVMHEHCHERSNVLYQIVGRIGSSGGLFKVVHQPHIFFDPGNLERFSPVCNAI